jgi:hypothetical protein
MISRTIARPLRFAVLALALCAFTPVAFAQGERSPNDLRVENDRLKERIEELEGQLNAANERIDSLEQTIQRLREQLRDRGPAPADDSAADDEPSEPERETAPTPEDPFASPASMFLSLRRGYQMQFADRSIGDGRDREEYIREVRGWAREAARDARGQVAWPIRVVNGTDADRGSRMIFTLEVIDQDRGLPIGEPFDLEIVGRNAVRLSDGADDLWMLEGVIQSEIEVNEQTPTPEMADDPARFIGPFAIFTFDVAVRSLQEID